MADIHKRHPRSKKPKVPIIAIGQIPVVGDEGISTVGCWGCCGVGATDVIVEALRLGMAMAAGVVVVTVNEVVKIEPSLARNIQAS